MKKLSFTLLLSICAVSMIWAQAQWTSIENPNEDNEFTSGLMEVDGSIYAGVSGIGMHRSDDGGSNWTAINDGQFNEDWNNAQLIGRSNKYVFCYVYNRYYKSSDKGATWEAATLEGTIVSHLFQHEDYTFYLSNDGYIYRSSDGGDNWLPVSNGLPEVDEENLWRWHSYAIIGETLYVGEYGGKIYKTSDYGDNWAEIGSTNRHTAYMSAVGNTLLSSHTGGGGTKLYISDDGGDSWNQNGDWSFRIFINEMYLHQGVLFASTDDGLYFSKDAGETWEKDDMTGAMDLKARFVRFYDGKAILSCIDGLTYTAYSKDLSAITDISNNLNNIQVEALTVYPNPANALLNIDLPKDVETAQIQIFNAQGKLVLNETASQNIDISELINGQYFARIKSNEKLYVTQFHKR